MASRFVDMREIGDPAGLTPVEREQPREAGRRYDGEDLPAGRRLADDGEETSFHGFCALWRVVDGEFAALLRAQDPTG